MTMNAETLSRALVPLPQQEEIVRRGFWRKVKRTLAKAPFLDRAIAAYYAAVDPATPVRAKAVIYAALAYFILPADLIPDILASVGFTDDMGVLLLALQTIAPHITDDHAERARAALARAAADEDVAAS
ncbi:MAG: YkvA family protein [Rhodospirillales bacterium]|jgi:uncharacterized membrane protein YkvA (DUF1232 family)|nr:YkvA family protein [Rhodospirillales bacterium]